MKAITTIICCLAFAIAGFSLAISESNKSFPYHRQTISAATLPVVTPNMLPLDLQLDLEKKYKTDTVVVRDTVYPQIPDIVINPVHKNASTRSSATRKRRRYRMPAVNPDTLVKNKVDVVREENPTDTIGPPKESIILIVDGEEVYKR